MSKYFFGLSLNFFLLCVGVGHWVDHVSAQQAAPVATSKADVNANVDVIATSEFTNIIAPLIDDQVVLIVHLNLKELDFDLILEKTILYLENGIKRSAQLQNIDARAMTMVRNRLTIEFNYMFRDFREIREKLIQEAGINDLFLLVYKDMTSATPVVMVSPLANKKPAQRRAFARIVRGAFPILFSEKGFMVCSAPLQSINRDQAELELKTKLKNLKTTGTGYLPKAFAQQEGSAMTLIAVIPPDAAELAEKNLSQINPEGANQQIISVFYDLIKVLADKVKRVSVGTNIRDVSVKVIAQTPTPDDAKAVMDAYKKATENAYEQILKSAPVNAPPERLAAAQRNMQTIFKELQPQINTAQSQPAQLFLQLDEQTKHQSLGMFFMPLVAGFRNSQHLIWGNQCASNIRSIGQALLKYEKDKGNFPPVWTTDAEGKPLHSWRVLILPYMDDEGLYEELYNSIKLDEPWNSEHNQQFYAKMPTIFRCPASRLANNTTTTYALIVGKNSFPEGPNTLKLSDVTDPLDATVMLIERENPIVWMKPEEIPQEIAEKGVHINHGVGSDHLNGVLNIFFFNGSIRVIRGKPPEDVFKGIITINGGEDIKLP